MRKRGEGGGRKVEGKVEEEDAWEHEITSNIKPVGSMRDCLL